MDLKKIAEIRERNRIAMEAENAEKAAVKARDAETAERVRKSFNSGMAEMAGLVLSIPGRPLTGRRLRVVEEIRNRYAALAAKE